MKDNLIFLKVSPWLKNMSSLLPYCTFTLDDDQPEKKEVYVVVQGDGALLGQVAVLRMTWHFLYVLCCSAASPAAVEHLWSQSLVVRVFTVQLL